MSNEDPRLIVNYDAYDSLTSDEEDVQQLQSCLEELDKQKADLKLRLERKAERRISRNKRINTIDVEASPQKAIQNHASIAEKPIEVHSLSLPTINVNEARAVQNGVTSSTASYFSESFANSRTAHNATVERNEHLLKCRIHTFKDTGAIKDYEPTSTDEQEEFSGKWIARRYVPVHELRRAFKDMKILRLPKLFSKVRPPKFKEPDYANWVAIGITSFKSPIKMTSSDKPTKYFKVTLTDFKFNLDIYIFGTKNVEKYYNLKIGDIIAILNPDVLPWRPSEVKSDEFSGPVVKSFNLSIRHDFNCILEIGTSKDLGFCQVYNKTMGKPCGAPINKSVEDRCQYHQEIRFRQVNAQRLELNGNKSLRSPTKNGVKQTLYGSSNSKHRKFELLPDKYAPQAQERESQNVLYFSNPNSAKAFFDDSYQNPDILNNLENKRRKLRDNRNEKFLQHHLNNAVGKASQNILSNKSTIQKEQIRSTTKHAINSGLLKNIGFDPTRGKMVDVLKDDARNILGDDDKHSLVKDIINIKKEKVVLRPSKRERKKRFLKREQVWEHHMARNKRDDQNEDNSQKHIEDSESDLEIV